MNIESAQVGDLLICYEFSAPKLYRVERLTEKQAVAVGGERFNRETGLLIGSSGWNRRHASIPREDELIKVRIRNAQAKLREVQVTPENLQAVLALFAAIARKTEAA